MQWADGLHTTQKTDQATMSPSGAHQGTAGEASTKGPSTSKNEATSQNMSHDQGITPAGRGSTNSDPVVVEVGLDTGMSKETLIAIASKLHDAQRRQKEAQSVLAASALENSNAAMEALKEEHKAEMKHTEENYGSVVVDVLMQLDEEKQNVERYKAEMTAMQKHHKTEVDAAEKKHADEVSGLRDSSSRGRTTSNEVALLALHKAREHVKSGTSAVFHGSTSLAVSELASLFVVEGISHTLAVPANHDCLQAFAAAVKRITDPESPPHFMLSGFRPAQPLPTAEHYYIDVECGAATGDSYDSYVAVRFSRLSTGNPGQVRSVIAECSGPPALGCEQCALGEPVHSSSECIYFRIPLQEYDVCDGDDKAKLTRLQQRGESMLDDLYEYATKTTKLGCAMDTSVLEEQYKAKMRAMEERHDTDMNVLKADMAAMEEQNKTDMTVMVGYHNTAIDDLEVKHKAEMNAVREQHKVEMDAVQEHPKTQMDDSEEIHKGMDMNYDAEMKVLRQELTDAKAQSAEARILVDEEKAAMRMIHKMEMISLVKLHDSKVSDLQAEVMSARAHHVAAQEKHASEVSRLQKRVLCAESQCEAAEMMHTNEISRHQDAVTSARAQRVAAEGKHASEISALQEQVTSARAERDAVQQEMAALQEAEECHRVYMNNRDDQRFGESDDERYVSEGFW